MPFYIHKNIMFYLPRIAETLQNLLTFRFRNTIIFTFHTPYVEVQLGCVKDLFATISSFQYISCYGSTFIIRQIIKIIISFQYISCYGSTVIHFTLEFNNGELQYISCYGSTKGKAISCIPKSYFNTSHVTVQHAF